MAKVIAEIVGRLATLLGYDGTAFRNVRVDSSGHLQTDTLSSALPAGAAIASKQDDIRQALEVIDNLVGALYSVNTDALMVKVESSDLPNGAATEAKQTSAITILELIQELRGALDSIDTDMLVVRQVKKVTRFSGRLSISAQGGAAAGGTFAIAIPAPGVGYWWLVTAIGAVNLTSGNSVVQLGKVVSANVYWFGGQAPSVQFEVVQWSGEVLLTGTDIIRAQFRGCTAGDNVELFVSGWEVDIS